jgi:hypothetical protein
VHTYEVSDRIAMEAEPTFEIAPLAPMLTGRVPAYRWSID